MAKGEYKYVLNYINDDTYMTRSFDAGCDIEHLVEELEYFLLACGWSEKQVRDILNNKYLYWEE